MAVLNETVQRKMQEHLKDNPCRGIVLGLGTNGTQMQISWIMGRSPPSQNRTYSVHDDLMEAKVQDTSQVAGWLIPLIEYHAMRSYDGIHIVSNGNQTDTAIEGVKAAVHSTSLPMPEHFFKALESRYCEPDPTIFTARISGYQDFRFQDRLAISVISADPEAKAHWVEVEKIANAGGIKKADFKDVNEYFDIIDRIAGINRNSFPSLRKRYNLDLNPSLGYMVTTYMPGSKELPPFTGEPLLVPIRSTLEESMQNFWDSLEPAWRVAVGGREITRDDSVRYAKPISKFDTT